MRTLSLVALFATLIVSGCDSVDPLVDESESISFEQDLGVLSKGQSIRVATVNCSNGSPSLVLNVEWNPGGVTQAIDLKASFNGQAAVSADTFQQFGTLKRAEAVFNTIPVGTTSIVVTEATLEFRSGAKVKMYVDADGQIKDNMWTGDCN